MSDLAERLLHKVAEENEALTAENTLLKERLAAAFVLLVDAYGDPCDEYDENCKGCQAWKLMGEKWAVLSEREDVGHD